MDNLDVRRVKGMKLGRCGEFPWRVTGWSGRIMESIKEATDCCGPIFDARRSCKVRLHQQAREPCVRAALCGHRVAGFRDDGSVAFDEHDGDDERRARSECTDPSPELTVTGARSVAALIG